MPKKKVAFVLSGGVSLGAYIAGALDELLAALRASQAYEIHVITGASAGATTASVLAHGLLYHDGRPRLHQVWVEQLDIVDLLDARMEADDPLTLLGGRYLQQVAYNFVRWDSPSNGGTRAALCAENLVLALTLANSTPLAYPSRVKQPTADDREETFIQERSAEQEAYWFGRQVRPVDPIWQRVADVARASAAIPFVFPRVRLERNLRDPRQYLQFPVPAGTRSFWYYDGGTYNNLPIDLAWHYAREIDQDLEDWTVVVVNPWRTQAKDPPSDAPYPGLLEQLIGLYQDFRTESRAVQFDHELVERSQIAHTLDEAEPGTPGLLEALPAVTRAPVELLKSFALVIPPEGAPPLRGIYLGALGAFLDQRFREYDFRRGAADARRVATTRLQIDYDAQRPDGFYEPDADDALRQDISSYESLARIPSTRDPRRSIKQVFEAAVDARIEALVNKWDAPGPDLLLDRLVTAPVLKNLARAQLPSVWNNQRKGGAAPA